VTEPGISSDGTAAPWFHLGASGQSSLTSPARSSAWPGHLGRRIAGRTHGLSLAYRPRAERRKLSFGNRQLALRVNQPPAFETADLLDVTS
jgi:hypothetical protein